MPQTFRAARYYGRMQIQTAGLKRLICLLHEKSLMYIQRGLLQGSKGDIAKAQNIIYQLELAVKRKDDLSDVLAELYTYCYDLLESSDPQKVENSRQIIEILSSSFQKLYRTGPVKDSF